MYVQPLDSADNMLCVLLLGGYRYAGCNTPMVEVEGGVKPAVNSRLFWEDIPFGLCILKDLALRMGIPTPSIDFMIRWHQQVCC